MQFIIFFRHYPDRFSKAMRNRRGTKVREKLGFSGEEGTVSSVVADFRDIGRHRDKEYQEVRFSPSDGKGVPGFNRMDIPSAYEGILILHEKGEHNGLPIGFGLGLFKGGFSRRIIPGRYGRSAALGCRIIG
jgi:hypothetical protein